MMRVWYLWHKIVSQQKTLKHFRRAEKNCWNTKSSLAFVNSVTEPCDQLNNDVVQKFSSLTFLDILTFFQRVRAFTIFNVALNYKSAL